jgi:hypothetical protein
MIMITAPELTEAAEYYHGYIKQAGEADILGQMKNQPGELLGLLQGISEERSLFRYAPDKWSLREVLGHINDTERVFAFRALWFARGFESSLPGFDQDVGAEGAGADQRSWSSLIEEFQAIRASTVELFRPLSAEAWMRRGVASGNPFTVRALAYIIVGHVNHHLQVVRARYL